ncbi:MAG: DUF4384 domain-containing protein [Nitrospirales bacterium]
MKHRNWKPPISAFILSLALSGCMAALPFVLPPLIEFAGGMINTALNNYDKPYNYDLQELMVSLQQQVAPNSQGTNFNTSFQDANDQDFSDQQSGQYQDNQEDGDNQYAGQQEEDYQDDTEDSPDQSANQQYDDTSFQSGQDQYQLDSDEPQLSPISLDVLLVRKTMRNGAVTLLPINDGDSLRDGRGNPQAGDKFRVMFRANTNCYVYVVAIDGSAWAQGVFPPPGNPFANPVKADTQYVIPEDDNWFSLDQFQGIETIFFVASQQKRDDIETIMARIGGHERSPLATPHQVTEAPIIPQGFAGAKRSRSPFAIQTGFQQGQHLLPTTFFTKTAGEALRVTRWFRHQ